MSLFKKIFSQDKITDDDYKSTILESFKKIKEPTERETMEYVNAVSGGKCIYCGKMWIKKNKANDYQNYTYYIPDCSCLSDKDLDDNKKQKEQLINENSDIPKKYWRSRIATMDRDVSREINETIEKVIKYTKEKMYRENGLIIYGDVGTGKTHLAVSVMRYIAYTEKLSAIFIHASELITNIIKTKENYIKAILQRDIILIDDIDKVSAGKGSESDWVNSQFFNLINTMTSEDKIILGTSNLDGLDGFSQVYDGPIVSRLAGSCYFVGMRGDDYRLKKRGIV